jgi:predicted amidohydrolase YtcJ
MDRRRFLRVTAAGALGALAAPASTLAVHARDTTVFVGGPIHSMTRRGRLSAIAIHGGRIVAVDDAARFLVRLGACRLDLRGRALYPGFIDAHSHWYGDFERAADANPTRGVPSSRSTARGTARPTCCWTSCRTSIRHPTTNLTHLILLHDDQIARLRSQRIVANIQLSWFAADDAASLLCWLGATRVAGIGRWRDLLDARVRTCGSTDFPWSLPTSGPVLQTLYTATTRIGSSGAPPPPWMAAQRITTLEAIRLLTRGSAWAAREETIKGALAPGMLADLVVFSGDPLAVDPTALLDLRVAATIVGGEAAYVDPAHPDLAI